MSACTRFLALLTLLALIPDRPVGQACATAFVPPGGLFDNHQADGLRAFASQDSAGNRTARSADDFVLSSAGCVSGEFDISGIRVQVVQLDAAPQAFALQLFHDNGNGSAPVAGITPFATYSQSAQVYVGNYNPPPSGVAEPHSIREARFVPAGLRLQANRIYWLSAYGVNAAQNTGTVFKNFMATAPGAAATSPNAVLIAPGVGVVNWTSIAALDGTPRHLSFAIDGQCRVHAADVSIVKSDGLPSVSPGYNVQYLIQVFNPAVGPIGGVAVMDTLPSSLEACAWACEATPGGHCQADTGSGHILTQTNVIAGQGTLDFHVACTLSPFAAGTLSNTATVAYAGDTNPGNNSSTDINEITPRAGAIITKTNGRAQVVAGSLVDYTITVTNPTAGTISMLTVQDQFPASLTGCSWTCSASPGGSCEHPGGIGQILTTRNSVASSGGTLTFLATCQLASTATGILSNTASLQYLGNQGTVTDSATDIDLIVAAPMFRNGFE